MTLDPGSSVQVDLEFKNTTLIRGHITRDGQAMLTRMGDDLDPLVRPLRVARSDQVWFDEDRLPRNDEAVERRSRTL